MSILFLPIDIDLTDFAFEPAEDSQPVTSVFVPYWQTTWISQSTRANRDLDRVLNQLPFKEISMLTYKRQECPVDEHVDVQVEMNVKQNELAHIQAHEPAGYRLVITGSDDVLEVYTGQEWQRAWTPQPSCYVINSTQAVHRVRADPGRSLIYIRGILDTEAHNRLIAKSLEKYGDWAIRRVHA